jgi:hypothetical protein
LATLDTFAAGTAQNFLTGGDGCKEYGWNLSGSAGAATLTSNQTNAGELTITVPTGTQLRRCSSIDINQGAFVFQQLTGDFDVDIYVSSTPLAASYQGIGLAVRKSGDTTNVLVAGVQYDTGSKSRHNWSITNSMPAESNNSVGDYKWFRIVRVGSVFTLYSAASAPGNWGTDSTFTRSDMGTVVDVGILTWNYSSSVAAFTTQTDYIEGTYTVLAAGAITIGSLTCSGGTADGAITIGNFTCSGTGPAGVINDGAITIGNFTCSGTVSNADGAITIDDFTCEGIGSNAVLIDGAMTIGDFKLSASVNAGILGNSAITIGAFTCEGYTAGTAAITIGDFKVSGVGLVGASGTGTITIGDFKVSGAGNAQPYLGVAITIGDFKVSGDALSGALGNGDVVMDSFAVSGYGNNGILGQSAIAIGDFKVSGSGWQNTKAVGSIIFEDFTASGYGYVLDSKVTYFTGTINTKNKAHSTYKEFDFNSYGLAGGKYYGGKSDGIYRLGGDSDNGVDISSRIKTGVNDFGSTQAKRLLTLFTNCMLDNDITIKVQGDDGIEYSYTGAALINNAGLFHNIKTEIGKGMQSRYWSLAIESKSKRFYLQDMSLTYKELQRMG